jgi:signal transduction histidine kinase
LKTLSKYQLSINGFLDHYEKLKAEIFQVAAQNGIPQGIREQLERIEAFEHAAKLDFLKSDIRALIEESREGTERIKKIVLDLKEFAHPGQKQKKPANLNKGLESTLNVVWNEFKHKARVLKDFGELPEVSCFPQQLNQVFMNVLMNAAQAVSENGEIRIQTRHEDRCIKVVIQDNGTGIEEKNLLRIFDPFFTTKDVGEGTGLGLNIAYNIVKKHNGSISVESTVGEGTTFTVKIPVV